MTSMDEQINSQSELAEILKENQRLLTENNKLLRANERRRKMFLVGRLAWLLIIGVLLFLVYTYYLKPLFEPLHALQENAGTFYDNLDVERFWGQIQEQWENR